MKNTKKIIVGALCGLIMFSGATVNVEAKDDGNGAAQKITRKVSPNDSKDFVVLSEAVPDVILEVRYYSTHKGLSSTLRHDDQRSRRRP